MRQALKVEEVIRVLKRMPTVNEHLNGIEEAAVLRAAELLEELKLERDREATRHIENLQARLDRAHTQNAILRGQARQSPSIGRHVKR